MKGKKILSNSSHGGGWRWLGEIVYRYSELVEKAWSQSGSSMDLPFIPGTGKRTVTCSVGKFSSAD